MSKEIVKEWGNPGSPDLYMVRSGGRSYMVFSLLVPYGILCEDYTHANYVFSSQLKAIRSYYEQSDPARTTL